MMQSLKKSTINILIVIILSIHASINAQAVKSLMQSPSLLSSPQRSTASWHNVKRPWSLCTSLFRQINIEKNPENCLMLLALSTAIYLKGQFIFEQLAAYEKIDKPIRDKFEKDKNDQNLIAFMIREQFPLSREQLSNVHQQHPRTAPRQHSKENKALDAHLIASYLLGEAPSKGKDARIRYIQEQRNEDLQKALYSADDVNATKRNIALNFNAKRSKSARKYLLPLRLVCGALAINSFITLLSLFPKHLEYFIKQYITLPKDFLTNILQNKKTTIVQRQAVATLGLYVYQSYLERQLRRVR